MSGAFPAPETPEDRLTIAISILQALYLASDTCFVPEKIFGKSFYMPDASMEHAIKLLIGLLPELEERRKAA